MKITSQISTMMRETQIGIENYQTMIVFCGDHNMHSPIFHIIHPPTFVCG
jgi:hypothetical protein